MKTKRTLAVLLAVIMLISVFAACSGGGNTSSGSAGGESSTENSSKSESSATGDEETPPAKDGADTPSYVNATGLPIVNEPVTLKVLVQKNITDLYDSWADKECVKLAKEETGLKFEWVEISAAAWAEQVGVIMAGGDMPDVLVGSIPNFGKYPDSFTVLDDLVEQYAPSVNAFFAERPDLRAATTMEDGHMYSLPLFQQNGQ